MRAFRLAIMLVLSSIACILPAEAVEECRGRCPDMHTTHYEEGQLVLSGVDAHWGTRRAFMGGRLNLVPRVLAVDAENGDVLWMNRDPLGTYSSLGAIAVDHNGTRVFGTGWVQDAWTGSAQKHVTAAYSAATGALLWSRETAVEAYLDTGYELLVSPDSTVVYSIGRAARGNDPNDQHYDTRIIAYTASTGAKLWEYKSARSEMQKVTAALTPDGKSLFILGTRYLDGWASKWWIARISTASGTVRWTHAETTSGSGVPPLSISPDGATLVATTPYPGTNGWRNEVARTIAWSVSTGERRWQHKTYKSDRSTYVRQVATRGTVTCLSGDHILEQDRTMFTECLDSRGRRLWKVIGSTGKTVGITSDIAMDGSNVYVQASTRPRISVPEEPQSDSIVITVRDRVSGQLRWRQVTSGFEQEATVNLTAPAGMRLTGRHLFVGADVHSDQATSVFDLKRFAPL